MFDLYIINPKIIRTFDFSSLPCYGIYYSSMFHELISYRSKLERTSVAPYISRHFTFGDLLGLEFPRDAKKLLKTPKRSDEITIDFRCKLGELPGMFPA